MEQKGLKEPKSKEHRFVKGIAGLVVGGLLGFAYATLMTCAGST